MLNYKSLSSVLHVKKLEHLKYVGLSKIGSFIKTLKNRRGWYCKVLKEGTIEGGDFFEKLN